MKSTGLRSMRGQVTVTGGGGGTGIGAGKLQLLVEDGLINTGYRIVAFDVWVAENAPTQTARLVYNAVLTMSSVPGTITMDASDNRQIAWAFLENPIVAAAPGVDSGTGPIYRTYVDPDHVAVRDLFLQMAASDGTYNYLIIIEKMALTDDEAIVNIIKEVSQSVP